VQRGTQPQPIVWTERKNKHMLRSDNDGRQRRSWRWSVGGSLLPVEVVAVVEVVEVVVVVIVSCLPPQQHLLLPQIAATACLLFSHVR
jgi:hypothetical protein